MLYIGRQTEASGASMKRLDDFKRNAEECRQLARRMPPDQRDQLLEMAEQWDQLAKDREGVLASLDASEET
jgi:hypothetical protein